MGPRPSCSVRRSRLRPCPAAAPGVLLSPQPSSGARHFAGTLPQPQSKAFSLVPHPECGTMDCAGAATKAKRISFGWHVAQPQCKAFCWHHNPSAVQSVHAGFPSQTQCKALRWHLKPTAVQGMLWAPRFRQSAWHCNCPRPRRQRKACRWWPQRSHSAKHFAVASPSRSARRSRLRLCPAAMQGVALPPQANHCIDEFVHAAFRMQGKAFLLVSRPNRSARHSAGASNRPYCKNLGSEVSPDSCHAA